MKTLSTPQLKFDDPLVKTQMVAERYRKEQNYTRLAGIERCVNSGQAVECYAGTGGLTRVYQRYFDNVVSNDINKDSPAQHHMDATLFVREQVSQLDKIDLIDFDCYGCPSFAIQEFFNFASKHAPFVLCFSDGFGMWMKRNKKKEPIQKRYLIDEFDSYRIWDHHPQLIDNLFKTLAERNELVATMITSMQVRFKNYTLGSYLFAKKV